MPKLVVLGAILECKYGSKKCSLTKTSVTDMITGSGPVASMFDNEPGENIQEFGECKKDGNPCKPLIPLPWASEWASALVSAVPSISHESTLKCFRGNVDISIVHAGQACIDLKSVFGGLVSLLEEPVYDQYEQHAPEDDHVNIPGIGKLTLAEIKNSLRHPNDTRKLRDTKNDAETETKKHFRCPAQRADGTKGNAFHHAYWNALMTKRAGVNAARREANAHENYGENPPNHRSMDKHNNAVGRNIARTHPGADDSELSALVKEASNEGKLVHVRRGPANCKK